MVLSGLSLKTLCISLVFKWNLYLPITKDEGVLRTSAKEISESQNLAPLSKLNFP